jgi:hypothetical protein
MEWLISARHAAKVHAVPSNLGAHALRQLQRGCLSAVQIPVAILHCGGPRIKAASSQGAGENEILRLRRNNQENKQHE